MRYHFRAISVNTKDLGTGLLVTMGEAAGETGYLFNVPDGFQRLVTAGKSPLFGKGKPKYVFLSSLRTEHFAGLPGYFLSARNALAPAS